MRRLMITLTLAGLAIGAVGAPATAGGSVRVVDDDGRGSPGNCASGSAAYKKIQAAIAASGPGDTILVCPGTYREQPNVGASKDGLTLRSVTHLGAIIRPPAVLVRDAIVSIREGATGVSLEHFSLRYVASEKLAGDCGLFAGVRVDGGDARVISNSIRVTGEGSVGPCSVAYGVAIGEGGPGSAEVDYNIIRDFADTGIAVGGAATGMDAFRNIVRYHHADSLDTTVARRPRSVARLGFSLAGRSPFTTGIAAFGGAVATIVENTVEGSLPGRGPASLSDPLYLAFGISVQGVGEVSVLRNRVYRSWLNISLGDLVTTASTPPEIVVRNNVALSGNHGIDVAGVGATIEGNRANGNVYGIYAHDDSSGNQITENDARFNTVIDCLDQTSDEAVLVDNTWTDNLGDTSVPTGLCDTNQ